MVRRRALIPSTLAASGGDRGGGVRSMGVDDREVDRSEPHVTFSLNMYGHLSIERAHGRVSYGKTRSLGRMRTASVEQAAALGRLPPSAVYRACLYPDWREKTLPTLCWLVI